MRQMLACCFIMFLFACSTQQKTNDTSSPIIGTWKLQTGTLIDHGDTTVTDYTQKTSFIKIINATHFAFLQHDLNKGKDSANASFSAGGGTYTLKDSVYTEHLEYCNARAWEDNNFSFTVTIHGDTLIQRGIEKVESAGINRMNIEKYILLRKQ